MALLCFSMNMRAQDIERIEYFFDHNDPGIGNASEIEIEEEEEIEFQGELNIENLAEGIHTVSIRAIDEDDNTSLLIHRTFVKFGENEIDAIEYSFDEIEPMGSGEVVSVNDDETIDEILSIDISDLDPGVHSIFLRARRKGDDGWSHAIRRSFTVWEGAENEMEIVGLEYFFGDDPGLDNGNYRALDQSEMVDTILNLQIESSGFFEMTNFHLRVKDAAGKWSLMHEEPMDVCPFAFAVADFEVAQYEKKIVFLNLSKGDFAEYMWDFGDGNIATSLYPSHEYQEFGQYTVTLNVANECGSSTVERQVDVKGIEYYTPMRSGNGGDVVFTAYGAGFTDETEIQFVSGSSVLEPSLVYSEDGGKVNALMDLHFADAGTYDVIITIPGEEEVVFENGFTIVENIYPECTADIVGPSALRASRWIDFDLALTNMGNVQAKGVLAHVIIPPEAELRWKGNQLPVLYDTTEAFVYTDPETNVTAETTWEEVQNYMSYFDTAFIEIDSLNFQPYEGKAYGIMVAAVPANETLSIPFQVKSDQIGDSRFSAFVGEVNGFGSPATPQMGSGIESFGDQALDELYNYMPDKNKYLKGLVGTLKIGREHLKGAASFAGYLSTGQSFDEAFSSAYMNGQLDNMNAYAQLTALDVLGSELGDMQFAKTANMRNKIYNARKQALHGKSLEKSLRLQKARKYEQQLQDLVDQGLGDQGYQLWSQLSELKNWDSRSKWINKMSDEIAECQELERQKEHLEKGENNSEYAPEKRRDHDHEIVQSTDPNAIYGPQGMNDDFICAGRNMPYSIAFENVDTASAAAQIVHIYNELDLSVFDPSTFEFANVRIAGELVRLENDRQSYFAVHPMPDLNLEVRISAHFDPLSGQAHWQFISIDPATGDLVSDPFAGFLLPNVNYPEGEGMVSYFIKQKADLSSETVIENVANIIFDENDPIVTNVWRNEIDATPPESSLLSAELTEDNTIVLQLMGDDEHSGVRHYELFGNTNGWDFFSLGDVFEGSYSFEYDGYPDATLGFYIVAVDSVGNREIKDAVAEQTISVGTGIENVVSSQSGLQMYPNPVSDQFTLTFAEDEGVRSIEFLGLDGKVIHVLKSDELTVEHREIEVKMPNVPVGLYLIRIYTEQNIYNMEFFKN